MKVYYDKSSNGEILFYFGVLLSCIIYCGLKSWLYVMLTVGWIPIILIVICIIRRKKYYIQRENDNVVIVKKQMLKGITKAIKYKIPIGEITNYMIENQKLIIMTKNNSYVIENFHVRLKKIEHLFK